MPKPPKANKRKKRIIDITTKKKTVMFEVKTCDDKKIARLR